MNPIEEHEERGKQRRSFLCEVYKRSEGNVSKAIPYEEVANSLTFEDAVIEQVYNYFLHDGYILEVPPMLVRPNQQLAVDTFLGLKKSKLFFRTRVALHFQ